MEIKKGENKMNTNMFTKKGFTLIELLVVVLIIGILAAIAVPQYQYAVLKSRYHTLMNMTKAVKDTQEVYYLQNGKYAEHFSELDISAPGGAQIAITPVKRSNGSFSDYETMSFDNGEKIIALNNEQVMAFLIRDNERFMDYNLKYDNINIWGGATGLCVAWAESGDMGIKLCKDLATDINLCTIRPNGRSTCRLR